jgi:tetratricopeptide (TPR) repeat protein
LDWLVAATIIAAVFVAYHPALSAGFVWDDNGHVTRPDLLSLHGLWRIWFEPGATQQYYPLLHSAFWMEHRLWGDSAAGYHLANITLHAAAAVLLLAVLRSLSVPGAVLAAFAFALHPVCAESVAWISEQKNTLSAVFYLSSALAYLRFESRRGKVAYSLATVLFLLAMATKSVTATLPAALLVVAWWRHGRISFKKDVIPLLPWFALAAIAGATTASVESHYIGASGASFSLGFAERIAVAGHAIWFYLGKAFWPTGLSFIYPHWDVAAEGPSKFLYPVAFAVLLAVLFAVRGRARGPLATALLFAGTLFPALGFINVYPFIYSYVADHFQYLALAILISAVAATLATEVHSLPRPARRVSALVAAAVLAAMGSATFAQSESYSSSEKLWTDTLAVNPDCWMAYQNLGGIRLAQGKTTEAIGDFRKAVEIHPSNHEAMNELGVAQMQAGQLAEAEATLRGALAVAPNSTETHLNLGVVLLEEGKPDEAAMHLKGVLEVDPSNTKAMKNLAGALFQTGHPDDAEALYSKALEKDPDDAQAHSDYGAVLATDGRFGDAIVEYQRAIALNPRLVVALKNLGAAFLRGRRFDEAADAFRKAVAVEPNSAPLCNDLGIALANAGHVDQATEQFRRALAIDPGYQQARRNLGAVTSRH